MAELNFDTGAVTYKVNGGAEIRFNPTDTVLARRIYDVFDDLAALQDKYAALAEPDVEDMDLSAAVTDREKAEELHQKTQKVLDSFQQMDTDMRERIDGIFGEGTSDGVFGNVSLYAFADGLPLWANFLLAIMDEFPAASEAQARQTDPRLKKYAGKYSAKYRKSVAGRHV